MDPLPTEVRTIAPATATSTTPPSTVPVLSMIPIGETNRSTAPSVAGEFVDTKMWVRGAVSALELLREFETATSDWFNTFYRRGPGRRLVRGLLEREAQRNRNATFVVIQGQEVSRTPNSRELKTIFFNANLVYMAFGDDDPEDLATSPFRNIKANGIYARRLRTEIDAFATFDSQ